MRHIYDLHIIHEHFDVAEVALLARTIVLQDAKVFGNQFPAHRADPAAETREQYLAGYDSRIWANLCFTG